MTPLRSHARDAIRDAWARAVEAGALPATEPDSPLPEVEVERPANPEHGDLATSLALKLARPVPPRAAPDRGGHRRRAPRLRRLALRVGGRGAARLRQPALRRRAARGARRRDPRPARPTGVASAAAQPERINVEFVSANPTGPLHIGNARGRVRRRPPEPRPRGGRPRADARVLLQRLRRAGPQPRGERRRDPGRPGSARGRLPRRLRRTTSSRRCRPSWPREADRDPEAAAWLVGRWASEQVRTGIEASLEHLGVHFDVWKTESSLHDEGWVERAVARLREAGYVYEEDGATWFRSTAFGDDKDRVIRKSNGDATYFAADLGYVTEKFSRGFDHLIYIWGADHHGTVARLQNAAEAMGFDRTDVEVLLTAWVRFVRDGVEVSMSKRAGEFITLDELLAEIGVDAARWFFGSRAPSTGIDFDIELAKTPVEREPGLLRPVRARADRVDPAQGRRGRLRARAARPGLAGRGARGGARARACPLPGGGRGRGRRARDAGRDHLRDRPRDDVPRLLPRRAGRRRGRPERTRARLALVEATRVTLANALGLLGISAPESM